MIASAALLLSVTVARGGARADQVPQASGAENQRDRKEEAKAAASAAAAERGPKPANWPLRISYVNTQKTTSVRLYDATGKVDRAAAAELDELLCDVRDPAHPRTTTLDRRTLQLLFRAAYHFRAREVEVISGYRKPGRRPEGRHGEGRAVDFRLPKVRASALAAYLRTLPKVGVGLYTHRATQFVHLDSRDRSYHWLDPSPPGVSLPERPLAAGGETVKRDESYAPTDDLPEAGVPEPAPEPSAQSEETTAAVAPAAPELRPNTAQIVAQTLGIPQTH
ncbi:MAG: DUF882 domain-containing protein [Polyangiaceae bacterium]